MSAEIPTNVATPATIVKEKVFEQAEEAFNQFRKEGRVECFISLDEHGVQVQLMKKRTLRQRLAGIVHAFADALA